MPSRFKPPSLLGRAVVALFTWEQSAQTNLSMIRYSFFKNFTLPAQTVSTYQTQLNKSELAMVILAANAK